MKAVSHTKSMSMSSTSPHSSMAASGSHSAMSGMSMGASHGAATVSMGGISMTAAHGTTNILPDWLSVLWTLVFLAVMVVHIRHVIETRGERRVWHSGHVLMAAGMLFMFAPPSLDHFNIPATFWQLLFANAAGLVLLWILVALASGRSVNALWAVIAVDFIAMVYMWSPNGFVAPITWLFVAYFAFQTFLWITNRYRELDERPIGPRLAVNPDGTITAAAVAPLVCERDLRVSMAAMTLGMAYMFAAMQLLL
jgi:hypothetical protein